MSHSVLSMSGLSQVYPKELLLAINTKIDTLAHKLSRKK